MPKKKNLSPGDDNENLSPDTNSPNLSPGRIQEKLSPDIHVDDLSPEENYDQDQENENEVEYENQSDNEYEQENELPEVNVDRQSKEYVTERAIFLKEFSKNTSQNVLSLARSLALNPPAVADEFLEYLFDSARASRFDLNYISSKINHDVVPSMRLSPDEIDNLKAFAEKRLNKSQPNTKNINNNKQVNKPSMSVPTYNQPVEQDKPQQPQQVEIDYNNIQLDKIQYMTNEQLLRIALMRVPFVQYTKIDSFIDVFKMNEFNFMKNPRMFKDRMSAHVGPRSAEMAFEIFQDLLDLRPNKPGFFENPYSPVRRNVGGMGMYGSSMAMGGMSIGNNPGMNTGTGGFGLTLNDPNYYYENGIIPAWIPPESQQFRRLAWQHVEELKQKKKEEAEEEKRKKEQKELDEKINRYISTRTLEFMDPRAREGLMAQGGNGNTQNSDFNDPTTIAFMSAEGYIPKALPNGKFVWAKKENGNSIQKGPFDDVQSIMDVVSKISNMVRPPEPPKDELLDTLKTSFVTNLKNSLDPIQNYTNMRSIIQEIVPQGNPTESIEEKKLRVIEKKIEKDNELAQLFIKNQQSAQERERKFIEQEEENNKGNLGDTIKNIQSLASWALPLIIALVGGDKMKSILPLLAGGFGGLGGGGGMFGGGGGNDDEGMDMGQLQGLLKSVMGGMMPGAGGPGMNMNPNQGYNPGAYDPSIIPPNPDPYGEQNRVPYHEQNYRNRGYQGPEYRDTTFTDNYGNVYREEDVNLDFQRQPTETDLFGEPKIVGANQRFNNIDNTIVHDERLFNPNVSSGNQTTVTIDPNPNNFNDPSISSPGQEQPVQQDNVNIVYDNSGALRTYKPEDFEGLPLEEIMKIKENTSHTKASIDSLSNAVDIVFNRMQLKEGVGMQHVKEDKEPVTKENQTQIVSDTVVNYGKGEINDIKYIDPEDVQPLEENNSEVKIISNKVEDVYEDKTLTEETQTKTKKTKITGSKKQDPVE